MAEATPFLVACDSPVDFEMLCPDGEPVIPNFPSGPQNTFIGTRSFKLCTLATVGLCSDRLNDMLERISRQFPGLPKSFHKSYIVETAVAAHGMLAGTKVRIVSSYDKVELVTDAGDVINLWSTQPL